jgi:hypothetical protein
LVSILIARKTRPSYPERTGLQRFFIRRRELTSVTRLG